jgi:hypothetical protein
LRLVQRIWLSYRDVEELLTEGGIDVDHTTIYRWVHGISDEFRVERRAGGYRSRVMASAWLRGRWEQGLGKCRTVWSRACDAQEGQDSGGVAGVVAPGGGEVAMVVGGGGLGIGVAGGPADGNPGG